MKSTTSLQVIHVAFNYFNIKTLFHTSLHSSTRIKKRSNLDMMGAVKVMFCFKDFVLSYLPPIGLAAANIDVLAFKVA